MDWKANTARGRLTALACTVGLIAAAIGIAPSVASAACAGSCPCAESCVATPPPPLHPTITITGSEPDEPEPAWAQAEGAPAFLPALTARYDGAPETATDYFDYTLNDTPQFPGPTPTATFTASASDGEIGLQVIAVNQVECSVASSETGYAFYTTYHDSPAAGWGQQSASVSFSGADTCPAGETFLSSDQSAYATEDVPGHGVYTSPSVTYDWAEND